MKSVALEQSATTRLFWLLGGILAALIVLTFKQPDPGIAAAGVVLVLASLLPLYLWLLGWSHGLPIWPVFSIANGVTFALALLQDPRALDAYTPQEIIVGAITMMGFLLLGTALWVSFTAKAAKAPPKILMIESEHAVRYLYWFVAVGVLFYVNALGSFFHYPGNLMPVVRGITLSLNSMGIFVLAYYHGRGLLTKPQVVLLGVGVVLTVALSLTSLMLASAVVPVALAIFGYMLGSNRIPLVTVAVALFFVAVLHPGKWEMRERYWGPNRTESVSLSKVPRFFGDWFAYGFTYIGGVSGVFETQLAGGESEKTSAFERAGNAHMLLLVQRKSPDEVPFLNGITYEHIPRMLIPRIFDQGKGSSHTGNVLLTVNYGLQTLEQTATTSIGWGLIPEAYANFGYLGVAALALVLAFFFSVFTKLSTGVPMTSLRFVLGLLVMAASTRADTMGVFVTTQFQGMVGVALASLLMMKRQPNPFATTDSSATTGAGKSRDRFVPPKQFAPADMRDNGPELLVSPLATADVNESGFHPRDVGTGGTVRTLPIRKPKRIARWMPRRVRAAVVAQYAAEESEGTERPKDGSERLRQLAVPYQNYRRYRA
jgi:hypothetical protein